MPHSSFLTLSPSRSTASPNDVDDIVDFVVAAAAAAAVAVANQRLIRLLRLIRVRRMAIPISAHTVSGTCINIVSRIGQLLFRGRFFVIVAVATAAVFVVVVVR